jgi:methylenetetrahydrofolate dehydrogenase (NADP+)/methenyltetrahydrofolate cyclohydrolase
MSAEIIDCEQIANRIRAGTEDELAWLRGAEVTIHLASVVVGDELAAIADQRRLGRIAAELGIPFEPVRIPGDATDAEVDDAIGVLDDDPSITAIVVARPLPSHLDETAVLGAIAPSKDVDAARPDSLGRLVLGHPRLLPSAAGATFEVLDSWVTDAGHDRDDFYRRSRILVLAAQGARGASALLLGSARRAPTVLVDPSATGGDQLGWYTRHADVLIVAADVPGLIRASHVRRGAVVLDAGSTLVPDGESGQLRFVGDVATDDVRSRARALTLVRGIGAVADHVLMRNVARSAAAAAQYTEIALAERS